MSTPVVYVVTAGMETDSGVLWNSVAYLTRKSADIACRDCLEKLPTEGTFVMREPLNPGVVEKWENGTWNVRILRLILEG